MQISLQRRVRGMALLALVLAMITALLPISGITAAAASLKIVATTSIVADLVKNVVGDAAQITTLVAAGSDAHTYEPKPSDSVALAEADLIFEIGLGFETWLDELYVAAESKAKRIALTTGIQPIATDNTLRLLVADYETQPIQLIDLANGKSIAKYEVQAPTYVYTSPSGRFGVMIQTNANLITAVDSGVVVEDHGDHMHIYKNEPKLTDFNLTGATPIHFTPHEGQIAIFNDANGEVMLITERNLRLPETEMITLKTARGHHGVAVPMGDQVIVSLPDTQKMDYTLPIGVEVRDLKDNVLQTFAECPGLHGEATLGKYIGFGCSDRVLLLMPEGDQFASKSVMYPAGTPDNVRVGTLVSHPAQPYFIGNFGQTALARIDPEAGTLTPIELPMRYSGFQLDAETGQFLFTVTVDGQFHKIDAASGKIEASLDAVTPFVFRNRVPRPGMAVAGHFAYVTDPFSGEVIEIDTEAMSITRRFATNGKPVRLAVIGILEEEHAEGEAHTDEHGVFDPHVWHDVNHAKTMVNVIRDALAAADAENAATYRANAAAYAKQLTELDQFVKDEVAKLAPEKRILVTPHNTFAYFAERYGFQVLGTALGSITTESGDPSAGELAELIEEIEEAGVKAIFPENISNAGLMEQIANEAGVKLAPPLFTDALGEAGSEGDSYLKMIRYNVQTIVTALQ